MADEPLAVGSKAVPRIAMWVLRHGKLAFNFAMQLTSMGHGTGGSESE